MVNKSRKRKQKQRGGSLSKLPISVAPIQGSKSYLIKNFYANNDLYYINAHGALLDSTFIVPPNTYIIHSGVSGKITSQQYCSFQKKFVGVDEFDDLVLDHYRDELWKLLTGQNDNLIYSSSRYEPEKSTIAIYEPGDEVHDMTFKFLSGDTLELGPVLCGAYKIPVKESLMKLKEDIQLKRYATITRFKESNAAKKLSNTARNLKEKEIATEFGKEHDKLFTHHPDNKLKTYFDRHLSITNENKRYKATESELVNNTQLFPNNKVRIFLVSACRAPYVYTTPEEKVAKAKTMRRRSLNLRRYNTGVREAYQMQEEARKKRQNEQRNNQFLNSALEEFRRERQRERQRNNQLLNNAVEEFRTERQQERNIQILDNTMAEFNAEQKTNSLILDEALEEV